MPVQLPKSTHHLSALPSHQNISKSISMCVYNQIQVQHFTTGKHSVASERIQGIVNGSAFLPRPALSHRPMPGIIVFLCGVVYSSCARNSMERQADSDTGVAGQPSTIPNNFACRACIRFIVNAVSHDMQRWSATWMAAAMATAAQKTKQVAHGRLSSSVHDDEEMTRNRADGKRKPDDDASHSVHAMEHNSGITRGVCVCAV